MLLAERDHDAVVGRCRLKFKVESAAKTLAQRQAPGAIDPRSEGSMHDKLHPAALIKETLRHHRPLSGQRAQRRGTGAHVQRRLFGAATVERAFAHEPFDGVVLFEDFGANVCNFFRQLNGTPGRFSTPEGNRWRGPVSIFHAHTSGFNAPNSP